MRSELAGGIFHVTMRGNARAEIFHESHDYEVFLKMLGKTVERFEWLLHAFVVLPNHFHLLVETPQPNLGRGMLVLNGSYARRYNAKFDRVGHVFQTPYRRKLVRSDAHFSETVRYIANNPVRARLCRQAEDWPWTSFRATLGISPVPRFLRTERVLAQFDSVAELRAFVAAKAMSSNHVAGHG
jgi:REP element-mobilizing transposase RayT